MQMRWQAGQLVRLLLLLAAAVAAAHRLNAELSAQAGLPETGDEGGEPGAAELDDAKRFLGFASDVCYDDLGCFSTGGEFYSARWRPVILAPASPEAIGTSFLLFTRQNPASPAQLLHGDADSVLRSKLSARRPTKLVIHGFLGEGVLPWMNHIRQGLLKLMDCNVIQVGWERGAVAPYNQAASNTRVVGAVVARMLAWLEERFSVRRGDVHIVGFSLGAHVAGYAGERMRAAGPPVARITGLDPAGPYFQGTGPAVRLDPTDAKFVDVVHTDASHWGVGLPVLSGGFGIPSSVGHVDFFANGGHHQPGCSALSACDHSRAPELFVASLGSDPAAFVAFPCAAGYDAFLAGDCGSRCPALGGCPAMGYWAAAHQARLTAGPPPNQHFLLTGPAAPYHVTHYHVTLRLAPESPAGRVGFLRVRLTRPDGSECPGNQLAKSRSLEPDSQHRGVFACAWPQSGSAPELQASWLDEALLPGLFNRRIALSHVSLVEMANGRASSYCNFSGGLIASEEWVRGTAC